MPLSIKPLIKTPPGNPEFVNIEPRYTCHVCNNVLRDAVQTTCGHRLCAGCIATLFEGKGDTVNCPANEENCQQQTRNDMIIDAGCRREVRRLAVKCTFNKAGCDKNILWENLEAHEQVCGYRLVSCQNVGAGCLQMVHLALMEHHGKFECNFRLEQCEFYHQRVPNARLEHHLREECLAVQLSCPYNCGHPSISTDKLNYHKGICPNRPMECTYKEVGCGFVGTEQQVADHMLNGVNIHLEKVTEYTANMDVQLLKDRREIQAVAADLDSLQRQVQEQQPLMNHLRETIERYEGPNEDLRLNYHKGICPNRPMECTYKKVGCGFVGTEQQVADHMLNGVNIHLEKVTEYTASMDVQLLKDRREIQAVAADRDSLQRQVQEQQTLMNHLRETIERYEGPNEDLRIKVASLTEKQIQMERKMMDEDEKDMPEQNDRDIKAMQTSLTEMRSQVSQLEARNNGGQGGATSSAEVTDIKHRVDLHQDQFGNIDRQMVELDLCFQIMETASFDGQLLWKLRDYSRRKREAVQGGTLSLYSQPFYTHRFGYKMCARICLNGDGMGKGTHLSLFFVIMRGEYDSLLAWPFQQKVTMVLMDQENGQTHLSDTFQPDPSRSSFKKPTGDMNIAFGFPLFVSHTIFETPKYVKDDAIFIKIVVDTNNLSLP